MERRWRRDGGLGFEGIGAGREGRGSAMDDGDGYPALHHHRKVGVLKKKKRVEDMDAVQELSSFVPVSVAASSRGGGHGVLKHKKKQKVVEVGHIDASSGPIYEPPAPVYDPVPAYENLPRSGVLKKRKVTKPPRPNLVLRGTVCNVAWIVVGLIVWLFDCLVVLGLLLIGYGL